MEAVVTPGAGFWRGRRVLLTGHTGFKGSWLTLWLARLGAHVVGYALPPAAQPALFTLAAIDETMAGSTFGDVRDGSRLASAVRAAAPEVVFHLAAQPLVRASYRDPVETYATNVMGTVHLLEAVRAVRSVRAVVVVTSDKCYENTGHGRAFVEGDAMGGFDPYSSSKGCAELVTAAYRRSFFAGPDAAGVATARAGNVVGGGDWAEDRLVPDLVRSWLAGGATAIRHPQATRPWQHVLEPLAGYLVLAERLATSAGAEARELASGWNFGPSLDDVQPVAVVADRLAAGLGAGAGWRHDPAPTPHEAGMLALDWTRARARLGWTPRWTLQTTLDRTAAWYRAWREDDARDAVHRACAADLEAYAAAAPIAPGPRPQAGAGHPPAPSAAPAASVDSALLSDPVA